MSHLQITILKIVKANDGELSWYQLDRALTHRAGGLDPAVVSKEPDARPARTGAGGIRRHERGP